MQIIKVYLKEAKHSNETFDVKMDLIEGNLVVKLIIIFNIQL